MLSHGKVAHLQLIAQLSNSYIDLLIWVIIKYLKENYTSGNFFQYFIYYFVECYHMVYLYTCRSLHSWEIASLTYLIVNYTSGDSSNTLFTTLWNAITWCIYIHVGHCTAEKLLLWLTQLSTMFQSIIPQWFIAMLYSSLHGMLSHSEVMHL